jgi:hypothetical protein
VAYFYCDRNREQRRDPENILRSYIKQLSISPTDDSIHKTLVNIYRQKSRDGFSSNTITIEESEAILVDIISTYDRTTLILDALDECHEGKRIEIVETFNKFLHQSPKRLKILISSREDDDIKLELEEKENMVISASDNQNDIESFVTEAIHKNRLKRRRYKIPEDLELEIISTLREKSKGMYVTPFVHNTQRHNNGFQVPVGSVACKRIAEDRSSR